MACVGQIGAPWSVAALRQRLGRSGRRPGQPSVLRMYAIEPESGPDANPLDRLHLNLVRSVAMVELLIAGWCEPPREMALHLSTLTHQILSVIAERGGASAKRLFSTLCQRGPFRSVDPALFGRLLRRLGDPEVALIEQAPDGALLLGRAGERIVEHYSFYASFQTPEEYQVSHRGEKLGTIPVTAPLTPGLTIILGGRRWRVVTVHPRERIVEVAADRAGKPPLFGGDPGDVHEVVVQKMRTVLVSDDLPRYLDDTAAATLAAARAAYRRTGLEETPITRVGERYLLAPWTGTVATATLEIALVCLGHSVDRGEGVLGVSSPPRDSGGLIPDLKRIAADELDLRALLRDRLDLLLFEKFHRHLGGDLLLADALSRRLDLDALPGIARDLCSPT